MVRWTLVEIIDQMGWNQIFGEWEEKMKEEGESWEDFEQVFIWLVPFDSFVPEDEPVWTF